MKTINNATMARRFEAALPGSDPAVLARIESFLREAHDAELASLNPSRLALAWGLDRIKVLKAFLRLTKEGVFNLEWAVHCPHCKGKSQDTGSLAEVDHKAHCGLCQVDFEAGFDRNVELAFVPNPDVVALSALDPFDVALASFDLEAPLSLILAPSERHAVELELREGNYIVLNRAGKSVLNLSVAPGTPQGAAAGIQQAGFRFNESSGLKAAALKGGRTRLVLENAAQGRRELVIARLRDPSWTDAALVSTLQDFRDFFSREAIAPGQSFAIRNLAVLFTDIKGSTSMYERLGDSAAFHLVKEHFAVMERVVRAHDGAVVKTIGDAVMAVFMRPTDALASARAMLEAFDAFNAEDRAAELVIKVGAHEGPCIAVSLNDRIDYFGTSVNLAARVQGLSTGADIVLSERLFLEAGAEAALAGSAWSAERFQAGLKGLAGEQAVVRLARA